MKEIDKRVEGYFKGAGENKHEKWEQREHKQLQHDKNGRKKRKECQSVFHVEGSTVLIVAVIVVIAGTNELYFLCGVYKSSLSFSNPHMTYCEVLASFFFHVTLKAQFLV